MNPISRLILTLVSTLLLFLFSVAVFAQNGNNKVTYQFNLVHIDSKEEATKLDSAYIKKKGIISVKTDFETQKVSITCISAIDFAALKAIAIQNGFEVSEQNIVRTEETTTETIKID